MFINDFDDVVDVVNKLENKIKAQQDDIQALKIAGKMAKEDHESLKTFHNNLAMDYRDNSASKTDVKRCFEKINTLNDKVNKHINLTH